MTDLFSAPKPTPPLAELLRPQCIKDVLGQEHLLAEGGLLQVALSHKRLPSLIFWGPPGCGKTTLARLLAHEVDAEFIQLSAIFSGVADLKKIFERAEYLYASGRSVLLFVDEIHRFNKAQQDAFLPHVESGLITLVGATTENPSFELNAALLSRCQVLTLKPLEPEALMQLKVRAEASLNYGFNLSDKAEKQLYGMALGDGRYFLTMLEALAALPRDLEITPETLVRITQKRSPLYDKGGEQHYNLISALHKSIRGSDADAALYWLARMFSGGEDPRYIGRRLLRMAVEDIGLAEPGALGMVEAACDAYERLGSPEGELGLAQAVVYLATAPKSNAVYVGFKRAMDLASKSGHVMPPKHILNAPTKFMQEEGYGDGYVYDPDTPHGFSGQNYFPDGMKRPSLYKPVERGFEREIKKRLRYWEQLRS